MKPSKMRMAVTAAATAAVLAGPATGSAIAAQPNQVCQIYETGDGWVFSEPDGRSALLYPLAPRQWFRVVAYAGDYYYGHGDGRANGYLPRLQILQSTCHYT